MDKPEQRQHSRLLHQRCRRQHESQTGESPNEDKIRFDIAGTEFARMDGKTFHLVAPGSGLYIGNNAGMNDDSTNNVNTFVGHVTGVLNTSGGNNSFFGFSAGNFNSTGSSNTFPGKEAGNFNTEVEHFNNFVKKQVETSPVKFRRKA